MTTERNRFQHARGVATWLLCAVMGAASTTSVSAQTPRVREVPQPNVQGEGRPGPRVVTAATAMELAAAMKIPAANIVSATIGTSDAAGVGVSTSPLGRYFPRQGTTFAILSTGAAADAESPDLTGNTSTILNGLNSPAGEDMVQLRVVLAPPAGSQCLGFDFAFFSEEFPEYVGSAFNDVFLAELGGSNFTMSGNDITAPRNFAVDPLGSLISVNNLFGVTSGTKSTYDGGTSVLRALAPLPPTAFPTVELVLTILDVGDSIFDSAVMLDNFKFSSTGCTSGTTLGELLVSPPSGLIALNQQFDFTLFAFKPVDSFTVQVNGRDISNVVNSCVRGSQPGGGATLRCPGVSGALLRNTFGQGPFGLGPYVFDVTANHTDGTTLTETITYAPVAVSDVQGRRLLVLPGTGRFAHTQHFDLMIVAGVDIRRLTVSLDGTDVTSAVIGCWLSNRYEFVGGGYSLRCPIAGSFLSSGLHTLVAEAGFADGQTRKSTSILVIAPNTEP
ncbi:MAG: choice-of-anchor L domain-containing protein [Vicinamibacterales bacterium]